MRCTKAPPHRLTPLLLVFVLLCLTAILDAFLFDNRLRHSQRARTCSGGC